MFCNEPIEKVFWGQPNYHDESDYFLDCYYDMAVHLCGQCRLVLETENFYLSLESAGVFKLGKDGPIDSIKKDGEWFDPCVHVDEDYNDTWTDYESTLFGGERLLSVTEIKDGYLLLFDDFEIKLFSHSSSKEFPCSHPHTYSRVYGTERLIKKCSCGGTGELVIDFVNDYGIRCNKCHRGTSANQCACDAIDEWNDVADLPVIGEYPEEQFRALCHEPVEYIVVERFFDEYESNSIRCRSIIAKFGDQRFIISSRYAGNGKNDFCFETCTSFNPEMWPKKISSAKNGPIVFYTKDDSLTNGPSLIFHVGNRNISVTADKWYLILSPIEGMLEETR